MKSHWTAMMLTLFIVGQTIGIGLLASGEAAGIISILGTALAGFSGIAGALDKNW